VLRSGALRDPQVIELIDRELVPVWINVRKSALPRIAPIADVLVNARVDASNKVSDAFSRGFMIRSVVLSPDGARLLNPRARTVAAAIGRAAMGELGYAEVDPGDYLSMLRKAITSWRSASASR
jgi:hypothetical protein